ncbi:MAG: RNA-binding protein [Microcoleus sp. PH2017_29_MFU_D_A]|jgi:RNA recognition motif-containing protein|uniref:RNA recognition motif domain-containing protein n=1 Tax=unclassified Microcoleus TaxID=2642155 RepID=UPI001DDC3C4C|nr:MULTISPECIES: RNA-binding protein [unclassified Microcoleus]MCC3418772.1 RNA-binding protein [Microcoleus sp. PH2017_07_MST_O_A]MCC3432560.1 RNA-binding protein [Microcoleus sp. PH2017_04_SCI_O_A]MCC3444201.1 RNA-binding protein [Microcoleus sp. PH2017_03_ELD_O_A]MCC3467927.1 RNA-binding protein [Microcoleus sp. PH2017_06_SFM_O_A]MCC3506757.1 RNA-binding protein [Microcoleus sp. PH2017_19_SFW_U_A]MCC3511535.1 RNA-binding protein [Microcoleus sp. PH2017_17_BER_D_A]TAE06806.1 MAG: RNA-bindi
MSIRLYVGNLPKELDRLELQEVFAPEGESVTTKVITDRKTGKCRGFGFVTVLTDEQADQVIEKYNGLMFKENPLKIEKALPRSKGKSEKGEDDQQQSSSPAAPQLASSSPSQPVPAPQQQQRSAPPTQGGGGGSSKSNRRRGDNNKSRRNQSTTTVSSADSGSVQPDPRWASALEELKQRLVEAQTTN